MFLTKNTIADVNLYGSIKSEYHPENLVQVNEKSFTLPSFIIHSNKPDKNNVLNMIPNFKFNNVKTIYYPQLGLDQNDSTKAGVKLNTTDSGREVN